MMSHNDVFQMPAVGFLLLGRGIYLRVPAQIGTTQLNVRVSVLLSGPNIESQDFQVYQPCLTIAQPIIFNMKKIKKQTVKWDRQNQDREPQLPLYLGMVAHTQTTLEVRSL